MKQDKRMILSCIWVVLGLVLVVLAFMEKIAWVILEYFRY